MDRERQIIILLYQMLNDAGWTNEEITKYVNARIE
jgi:hypothetical protein